LNKAFIVFNILEHQVFSFLVKEKHTTHIKNTCEILLVHSVGASPSVF